MRRRLLRLLIAALVLGASGNAEAEIEIGFANPLTGPYSLTGARNRIAIEMAVRDLNRNGGVLGEKIGLVAADDACGVQQSVEAARRLVAARVHVVIGHLCSSSSLLAAGIYEIGDVLMISPSSTHPRLTEEGRQNVFRLTGRDDRQGALAGSWIPGLVRSSARGAGTGIARAGANGVIDLTTSECFNKSAEKIFEYPDGRYKRPFIIKGSIGNTYDLRGVLIEANPLRFPILFDDPHNTCVVGPTVVGQQPRSLTWSQMKQTSDWQSPYDGDAVGWENSTGKFIIEGLWADNMEDGIGMPFDLVPDRATSWSLRHAYLRYIRDDAIENDGCLNGDVQDSFMDGIWSFTSNAPSQPARTLLQNSMTLNVKDSIIRMMCMPDERPKMDGTSCSSNMGMGVLFKGGADCSMRVNMENTVILVEDMRSGANFPPGTYKNVTLIWESGSPGAVPAGVTVTKNRDAYNKARASWLERHGCDPSGANCSYIHAAGTAKTPPENAKPYVAVSTSPAFIPFGNGGSVEWWTENVTQCTPTGPCFTPKSASGQKRIGKRQCSGWTDREGGILFGLSCKASGGATVSDSDRLIWFNRGRDSEKPRVPENVRASTADGVTTVTWSESADNFAIATYRIYRNNEWVTNVSGRPMFTDTAVTAGTTFSYAIEAMDAFGNLSGKSAAVSATAQ